MGAMCVEGKQGVLSPVEIREEEPRRVADGYFGKPMRLLLYESGNLVFHNRVVRPVRISGVYDSMLGVLVDEHEHFATISTSQVQLSEGSATTQAPINRQSNGEREDVAHRSQGRQRRRH